MQKHPKLDCFDYTKMNLPQFAFVFTRSRFDQTSIIFYLIPPALFVQYKVSISIITVCV